MLAFGGTVAVAEDGRRLTDAAWRASSRSAKATDRRPRFGAPAPAAALPALIVVLMPVAPPPAAATAAAAAAAGRVGTALGQQLLPREHYVSRGTDRARAAASNQRGRWCYTWRSIGLRDAEGVAAAWKSGRPRAWCSRQASKGRARRWRVPVARAPFRWP